MKRKLLSRLAVAVALSAMIIGTVPANAATTVTLKIDGEVQRPPAAPVIDNGYTLVPMRYIAETLGASVKWDAAKRQATFETAAHTVVFTIDSKTYTVDGVSSSLDAPAKLVNDNTMIPLRAFATAIGAKVSYDAASSTAIVDYFTTMTGSLKIDGSTTLQPVAQAAADNLMAMTSGLSISVAGGGSGTGIKDAAAGTVNIGMSSRELTADEMKDLVPYAVANDGIAIIVNPANKVASLTKDQAAKIFLGEIKNWADVGGDKAPIMVMTRETGSGTRATLEEMILSKQSVVERATPFTSSELIKQAVAKDKNAIGFDSIGFLDDTVKAVSLDGNPATAETVLNKQYGMGRQLFCCVKGQASGLTAMFIDYLRSARCQINIVEKEGYIRLG